MEPKTGVYQQGKDRSHQTRKIERDRKIAEPFYGREQRAVPDVLSRATASPVNAELPAMTRQADHNSAPQPAARQFFAITAPQRHQHS